MPKYYVQSGQLQRTIDAEDFVEAGRQLVQDHLLDVDRLGLLTIVSEHGFAISGESVVMFTEFLLQDSVETDAS